MDTTEPRNRTSRLSPYPMTLGRRPAPIARRGQGMARVYSRRATTCVVQSCPGRRGLHPHLAVVPPHAPAFVRQWELVRRRRALVELRYPAARGNRPYAPMFVLLHASEGPAGLEDEASGLRSTSMVLSKGVSRGDAEARRRSLESSASARGARVLERTPFAALRELSHWRADRCRAHGSLRALRGPACALVVPRRLPRSRALRALAPPARGVWSTAGAPEGGLLNEARETRTPTLPVDSRMLSPIELWPHGWSTAGSATTTDAASSGSRVSSCPSARRAGRRGPRTSVLRVAFPGPSLVNQRRAAPRRRGARCRTPHRRLAQAGRIERSWCRAMAARYGVLHRCSNPAPVFVARCPYRGSCAILFFPSCVCERSRLAEMLSSATSPALMTATGRTPPTSARAPRGMLQLAPASVRPRSAARGVRAVANRGWQVMTVVIASRESCGVSIGTAETTNRVRDRRTGDPETTSRAADVRPSHTALRGWALAARRGVVQ